MDTAELSALGERIRNSGSRRSAVLLVLCLFAGGATSGESSLGTLIAGFLALYVLITSTWAYVAASRILHEFCTRSADEVTRLRKELEEVRSLIGKRNEEATHIEV